MTMGSIRKRNYQWNAQVRIKGWRQISKTFPSKKLAQQWINETELKIRAKEHDSPRLESMTLSDACVLYGQTVSATHKGVRVELNRLRRIGSSPLGKVELHNLKSCQIQNYLDLRGQEVSAPTLRKEFLLLKRLLTVAITRWNVAIIEHPMRNLITPSSGQGRTRRVTQSEWQAIMREARQQRNPLIASVIEFAYETGMRRSEILSLKSQNIDFKRQIAHLSDTKNGTSRSVALTKRACTLLSEQMKLSRLFQVSESALQQAWQRIMRKTKVTDLRFHDLRHEAISRFFEMGMSIAEVQSISGHKDIRQLFNYTHIRAEHIANHYFKSSEVCDAEGAN